MPEQLQPHQPDSQEDNGEVFIPKPVEQNQTAWESALVRLSLEPIEEDQEPEIYSRDLDVITDWKLDQRLAEISRHPNSWDYQTLRKLVTLINQYDAAQEKLTAHEKTLVTHYDQFTGPKYTLAQAIEITASLIILATSISEFGANPALIWLIAGLVSALAFFVLLSRPSETLSKTPDSLVAENETEDWPALVQQVEELDQQIRGYFGELQLRWYLRYNVFEKAKEHIVTTFTDHVLGSDASE